MTEVDKRNIYNELTNLLTTYCDTCTDKKQMEKILLCAFKLDLIEYAETNKYDTVDYLWESIAKTLCIKLDGNVHATDVKMCNCTNGTCAVC